MLSLDAMNDCTMSTTAVSDYVPVITNVTFEPRQIMNRIVIEIVSDRVTETVEEFTVVLQSYEDAVRLSEGREVVRIQINDEAGLSDNSIFNSIVV